MARLVPAVCPQCGGHLTLDPALEWVTCGYCRASSFVETADRRDAPNHPPVGQPVIHVDLNPDPPHVGFMALVFLLVVVSFGACGSATFPGVWARILEDDEAEDEGSRTPFTELVPTPTYFRDATPLRALVESSAGANPQVVGANIADGYASFDVAVTPALDAFDTIDIQQGKVARRAPMLIPPKSTTVAPRLARLADLDLGMFPRLIADATSRLAIPNGTVISVSLQSTDLPSRIPSSMKWRTRAHWVVLIRNERHAQGTVSYDLRGSYLDLQKRP